MSTLSAKPHSVNLRPKLSLRPKVEPPPVPDEQFWILWNPLNRRPAKRHATLDLALAERARLKEVNPDAEYWMYECRRVG